MAIADDDEKQSQIDCANVKENPEIHSFRIVNADHEKDTLSPEKKTNGKDPIRCANISDNISSDFHVTTTETGDTEDLSVAGKTTEANKLANRGPQKYVLMCFICKLSFGETKSFLQHAKVEHKIFDSKWKNTSPYLDEIIEKGDNLSAIIQKDSTETPSICFLEPLSTMNSNYPYENVMKDKQLASTGDPNPLRLSQDSNNKQMTPMKSESGELTNYLLEEALKQRKLMESVQNMTSGSGGGGDADKEAGANHLNIYLYELCKQLYSGGKSVDEE